MTLFSHLFDRTRAAATGVALALTLGAVASAQDAYRVYVANEFSADISVIDSTTDQLIGTIAISGRPGEVRPRGMAVSPDGTIVYVSVSDFNPVLETPEDKIIAIDVRTNEIVGEFRAGGNPERLAINPEGTQVWAALEATAQGAGYDIASGERLGIFRVGVEAEGVAVSPDGRWVYISAEATHTVTVIDAVELRVVKHFLVGNRPREVDFGRDGRYAYVSAEIGGTISVVDVEANHTVVATINLGLDARPVEMTVDPIRPRLYVAAGGISAVIVIDTDSNEVIATVKERMGRRPWGVAITPDGKKIYTADGLSDSSTVIDAETLQVIGQVQAGRGAHSVAIGVIPGGN
jgi:YVTN family beta-propeller protein